ncbi:hypothetical protein HDV00_005582 [Rhizophlyctis rosea]|nr:hypothetical protein HDV00_005582 [Rhizophlyctis rosea]
MTLPQPPIPAHLAHSVEQLKEILPKLMETFPNLPIQPTAQTTASEEASAAPQEAITVPEQLPATSVDTAPEQSVTVDPVPEQAASVQPSITEKPSAEAKPLQLNPHGKPYYAVYGILYEDRHKGSCNSVKKYETLELKAHQCVVQWGNSAKEMSGISREGGYSVYGGHFEGWRFALKVLDDRAELAPASTLSVFLRFGKFPTAPVEYLQIRGGGKDTGDARNSFPSSCSLNEDQACYDFIKWYATAAPTYDWAASDKTTFLNINDADVYEDVDIWMTVKELYLLVAATLVKLKVLLDLQDPTLQNDHAASPTKSPATLWFRSSIVGDSFPTIDADQRAQFVDALSSQLNMLFKHVKRTNKHMWSILLRPALHLDARVAQPPAPPPKANSVPEAQATLQKCLEAWTETKGALDWVRKKLKEEG